MITDKYIQTLVAAKYAGAETEMDSYLTIALQTGAVLIGGIMLWRLSTCLHKKKMANRANRSFFETRYSKNWKRRN